MSSKLLKLYFFLCLLCLSNSSYGKSFVPDIETLLPYYEQPNIIMVCSPGRSGSTLLTDAVKSYSLKHEILKSHLLPPTKKKYAGKAVRFKGKILFIFSNPDKAAESALHLTVQSSRFGFNHFCNIETSDLNWLLKIGETSHQTEVDNLLSYDALGYYQHLVQWLYEKTKPTNQQEANVLAIRYENLWEPETIQAIKKFINFQRFKLPPKLPRGYSTKELTAKEVAFRTMYNLGTPESPRYLAYDNARTLWQQAPAFQYLKIID
jgi:hypothetical protein